MSPWRSGPRNPIASSTRSASNSIGRLACRRRWRGAVRRGRRGAGESIRSRSRSARSPPSSCADETRRDVRPRRPRIVRRARVGRALEQFELPHAARALTVRAVPRQSAPVSPPPMMIVRACRALIGLDAITLARAILRRQVSIAKWMPPSSRPGTRRSRGIVDPPARTSASKSRRQLQRIRVSTPAWQPVRNVTPSRRASARAGARASASRA